MILSEIDDIDKSIIEMLQNDPSITHSEIAKQLNRSQPAIGARIKKLEEKGILATQIGVNFNQIDELNLVKIEIATSEPDIILKMAEYCPYIINVLKMSGNANILIFMACSNLKRIDYIVDRHFRASPAIQSVRLDLVTGISKKFVLPISFCIENFEEPEDPCNCCDKCEIHPHKKESKTKKSKKKNN